MKKIMLYTLLGLTSVWGNFNFGECSGLGSFEQQIINYNGNYENAIDVGVIPIGIEGLRIELISDKDVDIRLYGSNEDKIVHWPYGKLSREYEESTLYNDVNITYSGYNGVDGEKGHEYIEVHSATPTVMTMKAFGYIAGYAKVNYSWTGKVNCTPDDNGTGNFLQTIKKDTTSYVGTIPANVNNLQINLNSTNDIDIQLYGADGTAIVSWKPQGLLSLAMKQSITYHDMTIEWSGYNGVSGKAGNEYIKVTPKTSELLTMKVFGYKAGTANVNYTWGDDETNTTLTVESSKVLELNTTSCKINWKLSTYATGQIEYGIDTNYGMFNTKESSFKYNEHIQPLTNLLPDTVYHYRIISEDAEGNKVISNDMTFKTLAEKPTENHQPTAENIKIDGAIKEGETVILSYNFVDIDGDAEGATIVVWKIGTKEVYRGTSKTYTIPTDLGYAGQKLTAAVKPIDEHGLQASPLYPINQGTLIASGVSNPDNNTTNPDNNDTDIVGEVLVLSTVDSLIYYVDDSLKELAEELSDTMLKSTGIKIAISNIKEANKKIISLEIETIANLKKDGFIVESSDTEISIKAQDTTSVAFGVYDLLERNLKVQYLFFHKDGIGIDIPKHESLVFKLENRKEEPAFINRVFTGIKFLKDGNPNYIPAYYHHIRMANSNIYLNHSMHVLYPPSRYKKSNPEFYPEGLKTSSSTGWQPIFTADGIVEIATTKILQKFDFCKIKKNKNHDLCVYVNSDSIGVNDGNGHFGKEQTEGKSKNVLGLYNMSDVYYNWANQVAEGVFKTYPAYTLGALAYHEVLEAPSFPVHDMIRPYLTYSSINWLDTERKARSKKLIDDWSEKSNHLGVYDYIYGDGLTKGEVIYKVPRMFLPTTAEFLQYAIEHGVENYKAEAYPSADLTEGPKLYIMAKLLWNPYIDIDEELTKWYKSAVGESAAIPLASYYAFWEDFWKNRVIPKSSWMYLIDMEYNSYASDVYIHLLTKEDLLYLNTLMNDMLASAVDGMQARRAQFFYDGWKKVRARAFDTDKFKIIDGDLSGYTIQNKENFDAKDSLPSGWSVLAAYKPEYSKVEVSKAYKHSGFNSLKLTIKASENAVKNPEIRVIVSTIDKKSEATQYCAKVNVYNPQSGAQIIIKYTDGSKDSHGNLLTHAIGDSSIASDTWATMVACTHSTNKVKLTEVRVQIHDHRTENIIAYFDDFVVYKK